MADRICAVEICDRDAYCRGLCKAHYRRIGRTGRLDPDRPLRPNAAEIPVLDRFWSYVDTTGDCWLWRGQLSNWNYGDFCLKTPTGKKVLAHRFSYELAHGPIPAGLTIDHLCSTPQCVNPSHLEPVTIGENLRRAARRRTHCRRAGHPLTQADYDAHICTTCRRELQRARYAMKRKASEGEMNR